jgi:hypothetical protein
MYTVLLLYYIFNSARVTHVRLYFRLPQDDDLSLKHAEGFMFMYSL